MRIFTVRRLLACRAVGQTFAVEDGDQDPLSVLAGRSVTSFDVRFRRRKIGGRSHGGGKDDARSFRRHAVTPLTSRGKPSISWKVDLRFGWRLVPAVAAAYHRETVAARHEQQQQQEEQEMQRREALLRSGSASLRTKAGQECAVTHFTGGTGSQEESARRAR